MHAYCFNVFFFSVSRRQLFFGTGRRRLRESLVHQSEILLRLRQRRLQRVLVLRLRRQRKSFRHVRRMRIRVHVLQRVLKRAPHQIRSSIQTAVSSYPCRYVCFLFFFFGFFFVSNSIKDGARNVFCVITDSRSYQQHSQPSASAIMSSVGPCTRRQNYSVKVRKSSCAVA